MNIIQVDDADQNYSDYQSLIAPNSSLDTKGGNFTRNLSRNYIDYGEIWTPHVIQRVVTIAILMFLSFVGNIIIIIVLTCSQNRKRGSRVNIFIIHLAVGDLAVCLCSMTTEILFEAFGEWVLGGAACKLMVYTQSLTLGSATFILTAMSFDRYNAICRPLSFSNSNSRAKKMILCSWILASILAIPMMFIYVQVEEGIHPDGKIKYMCKSKGYTAMWQRKLWFTWLTTYIMVVPAILICFCYINVVRVVLKQGKETSSRSGPSLRRTIMDKKAIPRAKVKTVKMTLIIILGFIFCWSPYFIVTLIMIYTEYKAPIPKGIAIFAETIAYANSAFNPIVYGCFNLKLKRGLYDVFCPYKFRESRNQSFRSGVTECMSLSEGNGCLGTVKQASNKCREKNSTSSGSDESKDINEIQTTSLCNLPSNPIDKNEIAKVLLKEQNDKVLLKNDDILKKKRINLYMKIISKEGKKNCRSRSVNGSNKTEKEITDYVTTI